MITINTKSPTPIFEQIVAQVGKYIALGILQPHEQLPTVRSLAKELGINPNTVSKAYHECEMSGLIYSVAGKGSFVSESKNNLDILVKEAYSKFKSSYQTLRDLGETPSSIDAYIKEELSDDSTN